MECFFYRVEFGHCSVHVRGAYKQEIVGVVDNTEDEVNVLYYPMEGICKFIEYTL